MSQPDAKRDVTATAKLLARRGFDEDAVQAAVAQDA